ncbi:glycosyltransferase [Actinomycetospora sp. NBC_00405]|uniref:glycosyltransferase n=1 Tax=Actinomycetospora sp. NBC_00405 TaxID=2975952 RepID=UPI002E1B224B
MTGVLVLMVLTVLTVSGLVSSSIGNDAHARAPEGHESVPAAISAGGPIIDARTDPVRSGRLPDRTVALTFDDGPDPVWTPEILEVLARHRVPGTFFVVGSMVARHPDMAQRVVASGSEIGVHTFTHPDLAGVSELRRDREIADTELAIAGATGVSTHLVRPPFSSTSDALDDPGYGTVLAAGRQGYVTVLTDVDGEDWQRPGVDAIVRNATPQNGAGATVLLHDAGGDRAQTVAALDRLIPQLQAQGYRFATVSDAAGLGPHGQPAPSRDRMVGQGLLATVGVAQGVVTLMKIALIGVGGLVIARLVVMLVVARRHAKRRRDPSFSWGEPVTDPVSVVVPAYNESENIEATVRSILANDHPLEVVVVDDGSTDGTADLLEDLALPRVRVVRQANAGKSAALNRGVAAAKHDLIVMIDGDTIFQPDTVAQLVAPFADPAIGAVAGNVKIANRVRLIPRMQHLEYVVGFNVDRRVQDTWGAISTIPGAAGAFRREAVQEVGGLSSDTLAEDTDLTIALGRAGWRVVYAERALAWTEAPVSAGQLWRQRFRWSYGTMQALWKHRRALRERGASGRMGRLGLAHIGIFHVALPLAAPLVDLLFVYGLLFGDPAVALLLWGSMLLLQLIAGVLAFRMDGEPLGPLWALPVQQIMYRQLMYVVLVQAVISALTGAGVRWQKLQRTGAVAEHLAPAAPAPVRSDTRLGDDGRSRPAADRLPAPAAARGPAPDAEPAEPAATRAPRTGGGRERWLDLLRAGALIRVVTYHAFGDGWMSMVFPSMGVMFALGGSLMVQSLRRGEALDVIGHRLRRLLPPLWFFGLLAVPLMLWHGWAGQDADGSVTSPLVWSDLLYWVFPLVDPPGSDWGSDAVVGLWYIRAYLWFVLLTPLMLWVFRRRPLVALSVPLLVVGLDAVLGSPMGEWGAIGPVLVDGATFAACWMLGFAHRDGTLRKLPVLLAWGGAAVLVVGGLAWAFTHPAGDIGIDLNDIPFAQALVSFGAVLLVLRFNPAVAWLERVPLLGRLVTVVNARAITIYLWHNVAIAVSPSIGDVLGRESEGQHFAIAVVLVVVSVLAFGWVEDLAAGRSLSLLPNSGGGARRPARRAAAGPRPPVIPNDVENVVTSALSQGSLRALVGRVVGAAPPSGHADRVAAVLPRPGQPRPGQTGVDRPPSGQPVADPPRPSSTEAPRAAPAPPSRPAPRGAPVPTGGARRPVPSSPPTGVPVPVGARGAVGSAGPGTGRYTPVPRTPAVPGVPVPVPAPPPPLPSPTPTPPRPSRTPDAATGVVPSRPRDHDPVLSFREGTGDAAGDAATANRPGGRPGRHSRRGDGPAPRR